MRGVAIDGQTLAPGGSPVTVSGTRISLDPTGGLRVGSWLIAHSKPAAPGSAGVEIYSNAGSKLTRLLPHLEVVVISGITVFPGSPTTATTISGTTPMSLLDDPSGGTLLNFFRGKTTTSLVFYSSSSLPTATVQILLRLGHFFQGRELGLKDPLTVGWWGWFQGFIS